MGYQIINDYHVIEKSNALILLDEYATFGIPQYILLDMYLSLINPRDPENTFATFPKKDYEKYKEVERVKKQALENDLAVLMSPVKLPDPNHPDDSELFEMVHLFKRCALTKHDNGTQWIEMECDPKYKKYFFNIQKTGYIKYRLGMLKKLNQTERYLYNNLHQNKYKIPYRIKINELKKIMHCNTKGYEQPYEFMRLLKSCIDKINDNTNLSVSYKKINDSNHVIVAIDFIIKIADNEIDEELSIIIAEKLDISYEESEPITKAAQASELNDKEVLERLDFILQRQKDIKNIIGYAITIMKNDFWAKIQEINKKGSLSLLSSDASDLKEIEQLYLKQVK